MALNVEATIEQLDALRIEELDQEVGVKDQVNELTNHFRAIQAVLADAEEKQLKDPPIRLWLADLKEISYEIDDVLDEWRSAMLMNSSSHIDKKVSSSINPSSSRMIKPRDIARKIKDLNRKLGKIANRKNSYNLVSSVGSRLGDRVLQRTTISDINITEVKGRVEEKEKIINMLLRKREDITHVPQIISIVGMGGMGKTTLAQLAYNDIVVEDVFKKRIWVCVSDPFDEMQIATAILESLGGSAGSELQRTVQDIKNKIRGEKYLLVLDDVWNKDRTKWQNVEAALTGGLTGSTILVTTRNNRVAKIMGCMDSNILEPKPLSEEQCWSIICNEVALSEVTEQDLQQLEDIGRQIARKCEGLPLAAKAFGGLLRFKVSRREWLSVLNSEMWQLGEEDEIKNYLFAPLWLSYRDLSPSERQCLSYCIWFPKDFKIPKCDLIKMWMAQGYLKETETKDMEIFAEEYFRNLSARCFFQNFEKNGDGQIVRFKMHDIVHDFVQFISKKECLCWKDSEKKPGEGLRHLFIFYWTKIPNFIYSFKKLRSLQLSNHNNLDLHILKNLFNELTCLRSLVLISCGIEEIPSEIGRLIHLRLLDITNTFFLRKLPETIGDLCNLLVLNISDCRLKELPRGIGKLFNLRHLIKGDAINLTEEIGRLNALREAKFRVGSEACSLGNLQNLNRLNSVHIILGRNVEHVNGAKQAQLNKKEHLVSLRLEFESVKEEEEEDRWKLHDEGVIEALQPCSNLEELWIGGYLGANPNPRWLLSLNHLRRLELNGWRNCNCLPPLGKLPSLTRLVLKEMKVKRISFEFSEIDEVFPKLEFLEIVSCQEWEESDMDDPGHLRPLGKFPSLTHLVLRKVKVKTMGVEFFGIDEAFPNLEFLEIVSCQDMDDRGHLPPLGKLPSLTHLVLKGMKVKRVGVEFLGIDEMLQSAVAFPKLECLEIDSLSPCEEWDMDDRGHCKIMPRLTTFSVSHCNNLKALPDLLLQKTTLKSFTINYCFDLASRYNEHGVDWPKISHIPHIGINGIHYRRG